MKSCQAMIDVGRRKFLTGAGISGSRRSGFDPCNVPTQGSAGSGARELSVQPPGQCA